MLESLVYFVLLSCLPVFGTEQLRTNYTHEPEVWRDARPSCELEGYHFEPRTGSCYKHHTVAKTWTDALTTCSTEGGYLAIVNSAVEAQVFEELFKKNPYSSGSSRHWRIVFLGFKLDDDRRWRTINNETLEEAGYASWAAGEPNDSARSETNGGVETCGSIDMSRTPIGLNDMWCGYNQPFICEKTPKIVELFTTQGPRIEYEDSSEKLSATDVTTLAPEENIPLSCDSSNSNEYHFEPRTGSCYKYHTVAKAWTDALTTCSTEGGYLAIANSAVEAQVFEELFKKNPDSTGSSGYWSIAFLGFKLDDDGRWRTIHNETLEEAGYAFWAEGEPNGIGRVARNRGTKLCGSIDTDHAHVGFNDVWCGYREPFICEKTPRLVESSTTDVFEYRVDHSSRVLSN